jgi:two-component system, LytTR family, sensor kinase
MKLLIKKAALLISFTAIGLMAFSQRPSNLWPGKNKVFDGYEFVDTTDATPLQMHRVHRRQKAELLTKDHYYFNSPLRHLGIRFKKTSSMVSEIYEGLNWGLNKEFSSILIEGDCDIEVAALDITPKNVNEFTYRIIKNGYKEIMPLTKMPPAFNYTADGKIQYCYLGPLPSNSPDDQELKIELYRNSKLIDVVIVSWGIVKPAIVSGYIQYSTRYSSSDITLISRGMNELQNTEESYGTKVNGKFIVKKRPVQVKDFIETTSPDDIRFRADDSVQIVHFDLQKNSMLYNYKVVLQRDVDGEKDTINLGVTTGHFDLYKEFWKNPGKYTVIFIPKVHKHGGRPVKLYYTMAAKKTFTVLPPLNNPYNIPAKTVGLVILALLTVGGIIFIQYRSTQNRKLAHEEKNKQIATLQLQSVRSQLNPHFIFNALAGIQNLMNKNEVENANKYLARFARLTRNVLDDGQKELTSIEHEVSLLTDYLEMEQMRFGFRFSINVAEDVDQQIEIPAMLLQPFVENAVKHGISALKDEGLITVNINQTKNDITLKVTDNGSGFNKAPTPGMGIKLCEERIKLLNSVYKNSTILLHINSTPIGAIIGIELKNWL